MAENIPDLAHASDVYQSLMEVWRKGEMTEEEFINSVALNLGKFIGWMKHDPADYLAMVLAGAATWREDSPMPEPETTVESRAKAICQERCAVMGEPACWEVEGFEGFDKCPDDARCVDLARATIQGEAA